MRIWLPWVRLDLALARHGITSRWGFTYDQVGTITELKSAGCSPRVPEKEWSRNAAEQPDISRDICAGCLIGLR